MKIDQERLYVILHKTTLTNLDKLKKDINIEETSIFNQITSLQDSYNTVLSSSIDDWESFCDAYLLLTAIQTQTEVF
mgnify:CR=1 FL=1